MTAEDFEPTLAYRSRFRPRSGAPGAHRGLGEGSDGEFSRHVPLFGQFDPRRIDLSSSLRDPFGGLHLRVFAPRRGIPVIVLGDLSASMGFGEERQSLARLVDFTRLIARSVLQCGDWFGLIGADVEVREEFFVPPTRRRGLVEDACARLAATRPRGDARGLAEAALLLPRRRALVFLVSDFLMPLAEAAAILDSLWRHDVVPIVVRDTVMEGDLPAFGFVTMGDLETGRKRFLFLRPSLRARWRREANDRLAELERLFAERGRRAFHLVDRLDVDALAAFFSGA